MWKGRTRCLKARAEEGTSTRSRSPRRARKATSGGSSDGSQPGCGVPKALNLERGVPKSLKLEHVTSRHIHPHHPRSEGDSHGRGASRAVRDPDVDARDRGRFVESEAPARVETSALLAAATLLAGGPARPEIEGFPIRLRRRVTTIPAVWDGDRFVAGSTLGDQGDVRLFAKALACQEKLLGKIGLMM